MSRHVIVPAVWMIIENEKGEYFMLRRANTGWRDGDYTVPAGHVELHEMPTAAARRELKEEADITVKPGDIALVHTIVYVADDGQHDRVSFFFKVNNYAGTPKLAEPDKADHVGWFHPSSLPPNTLPILVDVINHMKDGRRYTEANYSTTS